jgi:hypothetical protein
MLGLFAAAAQHQRNVGRANEAISRALQCNVRSHTEKQSPEFNWRMKSASRTYLIEKKVNNTFEPASSRSRRRFGIPSPNRVAFSYGVAKVTRRPATWCVPGGRLRKIGKN